MKRSYLEELRSEISGAPLSADGASRVLARFSSLMKEMAEESTSISAQRKEMSAREDNLKEQVPEMIELADGFHKLANRMGDGEPTGAFPARQLAAELTPSAYSPEEWKKHILTIADEVRGDVVVDSYVVEVLEDRFGELPWKSPRSVVSTHLYHSPELWKKTGIGQYKRREESNQNDD